MTKLNVGDNVIVKLTTGKEKAVIEHIYAEDGDNPFYIVSGEKFYGNEMDRGYGKNDIQAVIEKQSSSFNCHYCGGPAAGFGFFDEPACTECGGH